jgi:hypothetical protein
MEEMVETMALEPSFMDLTMHHIVHYRAHLPVGTFVLIKDEPGVWRIVKFCDELIVVNEFSTLSSMPELIRRSIRTNNDVATRHMTEVAQTAKLRTIEPDKVEDIAFVFKESEVNSGERGVCQGMANAFILRYKLTQEEGKEVLEPIFDHECLPFPSDYMAYKQQLSYCFPSSVWMYTCMIQEEISRILGRTAEAAQGIFTKKLVKITISQGMWTYLCYKAAAGGCRGVQTVNTTVYKRVLRPGMDLSKKSERHECELLRFETQSDLNVLCSILGESSIMNIRAKVPPMRRPGTNETGERELNENDIINVINGGIVRENPFLRYTNQDGVDLVFDSKNERASLYLRYTMYVYGSNRLHKSVCSERFIKRQRPLCLPPLAAAQEAALQMVIVDIDSEFIHNNQLYRVTEVGAFGIHATCIIPPTDEVRQFGEEYVRVQVSLRLG